MIKSQLEKYGIDCLYYMLHIENVPLVMTKGILSYNKVRAISHISFADISVQRRRDNLYIQGENRHIHDYVPLYFTTHTPMQYVLTQKKELLPKEI